LSFEYRIRREADGAVLATGTTKHAAIDALGQIVRIPKPLLDAIKTAAG